MTTRIRFEMNALHGKSGRVFFVDDDGTETDISSVVTSIDFHADVDNINTATLHCIKVEGHAHAHLTEAIVESVRRDDGWWARFRRWARTPVRKASAA